MLKDVGMTVLKSRKTSSVYMQQDRVVCQAVRVLFIMVTVLTCSDSSGIREKPGQRGLIYSWEHLEGLLISTQKTHQLFTVTSTGTSKYMTYVYSYH